MLCQNNYKAKARKGFSELNNRELENKMHKDAARVKKDLYNLVDDSAARIDRLERDLIETYSKAREDANSWVKSGAAQLSQGVEKVADDAKETMVDAAVTVKNEVGHGLKQYNTKAQKVAEKVSPNLSKKAAKYPWVSMSIAIVLGFLLGGLLIRPIRRMQS